jgi:prepilin-type processing-associated H-X9-DG protein
MVSGNTIAYSTSVVPLRHFQTARQSFGSRHPHTFNAAFADGSVRRIRYTVDEGLFGRICSRFDGQPVDPSSF